MIFRKGAVQILTIGNLAKQLSDRTRPEVMQVYDLAPSPQSRDDINGTEGLNAEPVSAEDWIGYGIEVVRWDALGAGRLRGECGNHGSYLTFHVRTEIPERPQFVPAVVRRSGW